MKTVLKTGSVVLFLLMFTACGPSEKFEGPLSDVRTFTQKLDSLETEMNSLAFDSLELILKEVHQNEKDVKKYFSDDTLDMKFAQAMSEFKGIRKNVNSPLLKKESFQKELKALQKQLTDLEHDISNGVLNEEEVKKFTSKEIGDAKILIQKFGLFHQTAKTSMNVYYTYKDIIRQNIDQLKEKREAAAS